MALTDLFSDIANAIREKDGTTAEITASDFPDRIRTIPTGIGGVQLESISIAAPPLKTNYYAGETFDPTGMVVYANYSNGQSMYVNHSNLTFDPSGPLPAGTTSVTVNFQWGIKMVSASQPISIVTAMCFGVVWDYSEASPALTRLTPTTDPNSHVTETVAAEPIPAIATGSGSSPFDSYLPWSGMKEYNLIQSQATWAMIPKTDSRFSYNNDTVVYIPKFWYDVVDDPIHSKRYWYVSDCAHEGMHLHPGSDKYIGRYETGNVNQSRTGLAPTASTSLDEFRAGAISKGSAWRLCDYVTYCALALLMLVEYATWDFGRTIGPGYVVNSIANTGMTDSMIYHTGAAGSGTAYSMQYRGVENVYGNLWKLVDGVLCNGRVPYFCDDPTKYANSITSDYVQGTNLPLDNGIVDKILYDENRLWAFLPESVVGSSYNDLYTTDGYYYMNHNPAIYMVGDIWHGQASGIASAGAYYPINGSNQIGARLLYAPST